MKKIILVILCLIVVSWFIPIIPYRHQVNCIIGPCSPVTGTVTLHELVSQKAALSNERQESDKIFRDGQRYVGYYENLSDPNISLEIISEDWKANYTAPNFINPSDENGNQVAHWNFNLAGEQEPTIYISWPGGIKDGYRADGPLVIFKVLESYKKIVVESSDLPAQIPIGMILVKK